MIIGWSCSTTSLIIRVARESTSWKRGSRLLLIGGLSTSMMRVLRLVTPFIVNIHLLLLIEHSLLLIVLPCSRIISWRLEVLSLLISLWSKVCVYIYANIHISMMWQGLLLISMIFRLIWHVVIVHSIIAWSISLVLLFILFAYWRSSILSAKHWFCRLISFLLRSLRSWRIISLSRFGCFSPTISRSSRASLTRLDSRTTSLWDFFPLLSTAELTIPAFSFHRNWWISDQLRVLLYKPVIDLDPKFVWMSEPLHVWP